MSEVNISNQIAVTELGVRDIVSAVAKGELRPSELLESVLDRIGALEDRVQAWALLDADGARAQAQALTAEAAAGKIRPLHGVPVGIKDEFHVRGMPTGMRDLDSTPPPEPEDATSVARLREAGAIILGKTHMAFVNVRNPPTRNPWNLAHTAGGTSSGSGAAVGARMVPFALGEQTMGSNLRPAAYCGVDALKPSYGRISRFGCYPFSWSQDHVGLIGLDMADLALVLSVLAGPDPRDPTTLAEPPPPAELKMTGLRPPRIGVVRNFYPERTEPEMQQAIEQSASKLREAGATVSDYRLPDEFGLTWLATRLREAESSVFHAVRRAHNPAPGLAAHNAGELIPATYYLQARRIRAWLQTKVAACFADLDALLMAVAPGAAPVGLASTGDPSLLAPWSFLGFPAISMNGGVSPAGMPLGLQFVGAPRRDYALLHVGAWCEQVLGRLPPPPIS